MKYLTIEKLFEEFPQVKDEMKWKKEDLKEFVEGYLLIGKYEPENSTNIDDLLIETGSLEKLIQFYHKVAQENEEFQKNNGDS